MHKAIDYRGHFSMVASPRYARPRRRGHSRRAAEPL